MSSTPHSKKPRTVEQEVRRRTLVAFSVFILCLLCGYLAWQRLYNEKRGVQDVTQPTLRKGLDMNEYFFSYVYSRERRAKHFGKKDAAAKVRVNGGVGLKGTADTATWRLRVARAVGDTLVLTLSDIMSLPKTEVVFNFKCIEGWSQVSWWGGVRFSDFVRHYHLEVQTAMMYAGMATPDFEYYVGNDMPSMLQDQTILCYEMNGKPLPQNQGYPLRLIIPVKYGVKHLKRIGTLFFSNEKPADYWAERGYDYYTGL